MNEASSGLKERKTDRARARKSKQPSVPPDERSLREAAVTHLARYETTRDALLRVLNRRIDRWGRETQDPDPALLDAARALAARTVAALAEAGALDDARFAARRASVHARTGRSARLSRVLLAASGVPAEIAAQAATRDEDLELESAALHARKRRLGPFAATPAQDPAQRRRALASFARAGFTSATARRILDLDPEEAAALIDRLRARD